MNHLGVLKASMETPSSQDAGEIRVIPRRQCFLCGADGKQLYSGLIDWAFGVPGSWDLRSCSFCEVAWLDPQPIAEDIPRLYSRYYTHSAISTTRFSSLRDAITRCVVARKGYRVDRRESVMVRMLSHVPSLARAAARNVMDLSASEVGTLLDVGCGNGAFLEAIQALGWSVTGVDPDPAAVRYGQSRGLSVFCGTITDVPAGNRYDVITVNHVIEHVTDPVVFLKQCAAYLRPASGRIIVTTPNMKSFGHWWFKSYWRGLEVPRHLSLFSPQGLSRCATRAGLSLISLSSETRMAHMIYNPSAYAKQGERNVGERTNFKVRTKAASYFFQLLEDALIKLKPDAGEEIFFLCGTRLNS